MDLGERQERLLQDSHQYGKKKIIIVKIPGFQKSFPAAAEKGGEGRGEYCMILERRGEGGGGREKVSASEVNVGVDSANSETSVAMNGALRISPRVTSKPPLSASSSLASVIARTSAYPSATTTLPRAVASASSLSTSKQDDGRRAERLDEALQYAAWLCVRR